MWVWRLNCVCIKLHSLFLKELFALSLESLAGRIDILLPSAGVNVLKLWVEGTYSTVNKQSESERELLCVTGVFILCNLTPSLTIYGEHHSQQICNYTYFLSVCCTLTSDRCKWICKMWEYVGSHIYMVKKNKTKLDPPLYTEVNAQQCTTVNSTQKQLN